MSANNATQTAPDYMQYINKGWEYVIKTDMNGAEKCFQKGLRCARQAEDIVGQGRFLNALGCVENNRSRYVAAMDYYQQALQIFEDAGDADLRNVVLGHLANIYYAQGLYEEAETHFDQAMQAHRSREKKEDSPHLLITQNTMISCLIDQKKYAKAEKALQEINLQIATLKESYPLRYNIHQLLAESSRAIILFEKGRRSEAFVCINSVLATTRELANRYEEANSLLILGTYSKQKSRQYLEEALRISQEMETMDLTIKIHEALVVTHKKAGRWQLALTHIEASRALSQQIFAPQTNHHIEQLRQKELLNALKTAQHLREVAQKMAHQDSLTSLYNRRYMITSKKSTTNTPTS
jgi:tetratricopeptide (TPR) repeat protein